MKFHCRFVLVACSLMITVQAWAAVRLPDIFSDHMVLQRQQRIPVWGSAAPGEQVVVSFNNQTQHTMADTQGNWKVYLGPFQAIATPDILTVSASNRIELHDIVVGEVWFCSGQSNMQWTLEQSAGGAEAIALADFPQIRLFNVSREVAFNRKSGKLANWQVCTPESVRDFSGIGYFFGLELYRALGVPVGLVNASYGGSQAEAWTPVEALAANPALQLCIEREKIWAAERPAVQAKYNTDMEAWKEAVERARAEGKVTPAAPKVPDALRDYRIAASIYDRMVAPLIPFGIRGVLWYQGESNEERAEQYEILLPVLIEAWRTGWGQGNFPFAIVQLPNFRAPAPQPADEAWSYIREAQRLTQQRVPNTGLIVTIDLGEANDIHPTNKRDVAHRIWRWAIHTIYGRKDQVSGPEFEKASITGDKIILHFRSTGKGLRTSDGQAPRMFAIAGADRKFVWAEARILGKRKVEVSSLLITAPQSVRYAFNNNPAGANLTNHTGIPAGPFRTDTWPGPTTGKR